MTLIVSQEIMIFVSKTLLIRRVVVKEEFHINSLIISDQSDSEFHFLSVYYQSKNYCQDNFKLFEKNYTEHCYAIIR